MANFLEMSWQKWNIHGTLLIYFLLESYRITAFGKITDIRLVPFESDNNTSYSGKVEILILPSDTLSCSGYLYPLVPSCPSDNWYGVCHDGDDDAHIPSWNREAATAACKQLGYEAGWNRSETGLTEYYSIEGFNCTDQSSSLAECTSDGTEYCGCNTYQPEKLLHILTRCYEHSYNELQAAVECFDFTDISLYLKDVGSNKKKLDIEYRGELYDVCFNGASKNWSMDEADVACRQMGYQQGALSTNQLNLPTQLSKSFADFSCDGGESNLFNCFSKPPRSKRCGDVVLLTCQGNRDKIETSSINTRTNEDFSTRPTDINADGKETSSMKNTDFSTRGIIVGATVGVISVLLIIIVAVLCHVQYRRKTLLKRSTQSQHQQPASTTHPNNVYDAGSAEYAEVQDPVQNPNTDYAYAYSHVGNGRVSLTQPATDTTCITNQSGTNSEGWADNAAYNSYGDDGLNNHNADGLVLSPSNLPAQNQTVETEGWAENDAYAHHGDVAADRRNQTDEGWQDNTVYVQN